MEDTLYSTNVDSEYECSICMELMVEPMTVPCGHSFCYHCIGKWITQQIAPKCPGCNRMIHDKMINVSYTLRSLIRKKYPAMYEKRYNETQEQRLLYCKKLCDLFNTSSRGGGLRNYRRGGHREQHMETLVRECSKFFIFILGLLTIYIMLSYLTNFDSYMESLTGHYVYGNEVQSRKAQKNRFIQRHTERLHSLNTQSMLEEYLSHHTNWDFHHMCTHQTNTVRGSESYRLCLQELVNKDMNSKKLIQVNKEAMSSKLRVSRLKEWNISQLRKYLNDNHMYDHGTCREKQCFIDLIRAHESKKYLKKKKRSAENPVTDSLSAMLGLDFERSAREDDWHELHFFISAFLRQNPFVALVMELLPFLFG